MMLMSIEQIVERLDRQFLPLEPMLSGFRLVPSQPDEDALREAEKNLGTILPQQFVEYVGKYDFGNLTIGPTVFGARVDYLDKLVADNSESQFPWWGSGTRPNDLVSIAYTESWTVLLNIEGGIVNAFPNGEPWQTTLCTVAESFELFLRGIGTLFCLRQVAHDHERLGREVAVSVGADMGLRFWHDLAR